MTTAADVRERPMLFSGEMVRAIIDGRKTMTRRVLPKRVAGAVTFYACEEGFEGESQDADHRVEWFNDGHSGPGYYVWCGEYPGEGSDFLGQGYGQPGDRLWVRETWAPVVCIGCAWQTEEGPSGDLRQYEIRYAADGRDGVSGRWRPSIHMPRWACRITLEITDVRVERVQEITEEAAIAEGCVMDPRRPGFPAELPHESGVGDVGWDDAREWFADLWDGLNAARGYGWEANPWVWVISFRPIEGVS